MIRVSVIGAGWYAAQNHIPVLKGRNDVVLDGVSRLGAAELARVQNHFGFAFASEDFREVLARKPDAVVVASPHHLHYPHVAAALEAGGHVLCEKPMTVDPAEARDLVRRAVALRRHLLIANGYQYLPHLAAIRAALASGAAGAIEHVACSFVSVTRNVFAGDAGLNSWKTSFFRPSRATWQDPATGGGFAFGQMSHSIALLLWLTGLRPEAVSARGAGDPVDLTDAAAVRFAGGATGSIDGAAAMPEGHRALLRLTISGSRGVLTLELDRDLAELRLDGGVVERFPVASGEWVYNCAGPVHALVDLAQGRGVNHSPAEIGAATVAVLDAMRRSASANGALAAVHGSGAPGGQ
jgi:predicted dehydrogenase